MLSKDKAGTVSINPVLSASLKSRIRIERNGGDAGDFNSQHKRQHKIQVRICSNVWAWDGTCIYYSVDS